jgi:hypothetical protein
MDRIKEERDLLKQREGGSEILGFEKTSRWIWSLICSITKG